MNRWVIEAVVRGGLFGAFGGVLVACSNPPPPAEPMPPPPPPPPAPTDAHYLMARDGIKCALSGYGNYPTYEKAVAQEQQRLTGMGLQVSEVWISENLTANPMPAACVPANKDSFFSRNPVAQAGVRAATGLVALCANCGCPLIHYYCVRSNSGADALKSAGYAQVK